MTMRTKGVVVLAVQMALVLSIAAKYARERHVCPMVWARATQYDPEQPLRGRYLALTLHAEACGLPKAGHEERDDASSEGGPKLNDWSWEVLPAASNGRLVPVLADKEKPGETQTLQLRPQLPCEYAAFSEQIEFFIAEHAKTPFPLPKGKELWALVTVPPSGPPRPVRLAVSDGKDFRVLDLR